MSLLAAALVMMGMSYGDPAIGSRLNPGTRRQYNADMGNPQESMFRFTECTVTLNEGKMRTYLDTRSQAEFAVAHAHSTSRTAPRGATPTAMSAAMLRLSILAPMLESRGV